MSDPAVPPGTAYLGPYPSLLYVAAWAPLHDPDDETVVRAARRRCLANLSAQVRSTRLLGASPDSRPVGTLCDIEARPADAAVVLDSTGSGLDGAPYVIIATARVQDRR